MKRRLFLAAPVVSLFPISGRAADQVPWTAKLLKGGFVADTWWAGLQVDLAPGWKTYWRVPGDGGIAPSLQLTGSNLKSVTYEYPLPHRFQDEAGETIGYKSQVVFPIAAEPLDSARPMQLKFQSFIGVCEVVCIPAQFETEIVFDPANTAAPGQAEIGMWSGRVPRKTHTPAITEAKVITNGAGVALQLTLLQTVKDIFVEGGATHYFSKPEISSGTATFKVSGAKSAADLKGITLRITIDTGSEAIEQSIIVT